MCILRRRVRSALAELNAALRLGAIAAALLVPLPGRAASTPAPASPPARIDVTKIQPKALLPKKHLHTEFVVEINKLGQVARVRSVKSAPDATFNAQTYGNALQAAIRTPEGRVVVGTYRLSYDYDPKTTRVHRDVALIKRGGVDPNAIGAVPDMLKHAHPRTPPSAVTPGPAPSVNIQRLPDLNNVIKPTASPTPR